MPITPELPVNLESFNLAQEVAQETRRSQEFTSRVSRFLGHAALALVLTTGAAVAVSVGEAALSPAKAMATTESVADYPWAAASHVPQPPATDSITWGYSSQATCSDKSSDYDCSSTHLTGPWYYRDQWGYDLRNCTSYVAWRVAANLGYDISGLGYATNWNNNAVAKGWTDDSTPEPGDIAHWEGSDSSPASSPGHVAFVESVNSDGTVNISEFNRGLDGNSGTRNNVRANDYIDVNGTGKGLNNAAIGGGSSGGGGGGAPAVTGLKAPSAINDPATGKNVFYTGADNTLWQDGVSGTQWSIFRIGAPMAANTSPSAIIDQGTGRNIFFQGADGTLHQESVSNNAWVDFRIGSPMAPNTSPAAVEDPTYGRQIFFVGADNAIHQESVSNGAWVDFRMGGSVAPNTSPTVSDDPTYGRQIFYVGADYAINQWSVSNGAWANFRIGGGVAANTSPSAVVDGATGRNIFYVGGDGAIYQWSVDGTGWVSARLGGVVEQGASPVVVDDSTNGRNIFFPGSNGTAYQESVSNNAWTLYPLGTGSQPVAPGTSIGAMDTLATGRQLFYMGADGAMYQWSVSGSAWVNYRIG